MILEIYKHPKNDAVKEYYVYALNRVNNDDIWYFAFDLKTIIEMHKTYDYRFTKKDANTDKFELISSKEYKNIEEIEFEYMHKLI